MLVAAELVMSLIALHLLGTPLLKRDSATVSLTRGKTLALLAYLAVTRARQQRGALAALLWPEHDAEKGLGSLRTAVWQLQRELGDGWLDADRLGLALRPGAVWVDVDRFQQLAAPSAETRPSLALASLADAVALYRGEFLQGFTLRDCQAFDEWQGVQTEHFRLRFTSVLERLISGHSTEGRPDEAIHFARTLVAADTMNEGAHRRLMRLYAESGRSGEALRQYEICAATLARELQAAPHQDTRELYEAIKAGRVGAPSAGLPTPAAALAVAPRPAGAPPAPHGHGLPAAVTPLVGREVELMMIAQRLDNPACRLVTLTGPGGVGKTSLALEAARRRRQTYRDGACFVALAAVAESELIATTMAEALGLSLSGSGPPEERLAELLRAREMLLVLDNFEHLAAGAEVISRLLARAPALDILLTSRERLHLRGEWEVVVPGLLVPDGSAGEEPPDAVRLFALAAARADASFQLRPEDDPAVRRICRALGGMPLGIELAAAWVRHFTPAEIAARLEQDSNFLEGPRDAPARQRSMRASFIYSWRLLGDHERRALRRLSVFRGGVTEEAAAIMDAPLGTLASLCAKFLLRRSPADRYEVHELIRQYAAEQLHAEAEDHRWTRERHAEHFTALLERRRPDLDGPKQRAALAALDAELDNVRAAWSWSVEHARFELIERALQGLCALHEIRGRFHEAQAELRGAEDAARTAARERPELRRLLGRILSHRCRFALETMRPAQVTAVVEEALEILRDAGAEADLGVTLIAAGRLALRQGNHSAARWSFRGSLALAKRVGDKHRVAVALDELATVSLRSGSFRKAEILLRRSLAIFRNAGDERRAATCLSNLGDALALDGEWERAVAAYREGIRLVKPFDDRLRTSGLLVRLARALCLQGQLEEARRRYEECLVAGRDMAHTETIAGAIHGLGLVAHRAKEAAEAKRLFTESLELWRGLQARRGMAESLNALGILAAEQGDLPAALSHFSAALRMAVEIDAVPLVLEILVGIAEVPDPARKRARLRNALAAILVHPAAERLTRDRAAHLLADGKARPQSKPLQIPELPSLVADVTGDL